MTFLLFISIIVQLEILRQVKRLPKRFGHGKHPHPIRIKFFLGDFEVTEMNLKVSQNLPIAILAEDEFGNPTGALEGVPAWSLTDPSLGAVAVSADGMSAVVAPSGKLGDCQVQVAGMADGKAILGTLDLSMIPGDAVQIVLQAGAAFDPTP